MKRNPDILALVLIGIMIVVIAALTVILIVR